MPRIQICTRILFIFFILVMWNSHASAEKITVVTEDWTPYNYSENGTATGIVTEIVRAVLDESGLDYGIKVYPWARAYQMAQKNNNTLIYSIIKLPDRTDLFKWIKIEGLSVDMFLFRPEGRKDIALTSLEDAKKYRIGVTRQTSTHHFLLSEGFKEGVNLFPVNSEEQNMLKSAPSRQRIDMSTGDRLSTAAWLKKAGYPPDYWHAELLLFQEDIYMAFSPMTQASIIEKVRTALKKIKAKGVLDDIIRKYETMLRSRDESD